MDEKPYVYGVGVKGSENMEKKEERQKGKSSRRRTFLKELAEGIKRDQDSEVDELEYKGRSKGFLILPPTFVYVGDHLTQGEKIAWMVIFKHNWCEDQNVRVSWPGRETLAIEAGVKVRQFSTYLNGLKRKKVLFSKRRQNNTSLYLLYDPPKEWMQETKRKLEQSKIRRIREREKRNEELVESFSRQDRQKTAH